MNHQPLTMNTQAAVLPLPRPLLEHSPRNHDRLPSQKPEPTGTTLVELLSRLLGIHAGTALPIYFQGNAPPTEDGQASHDTEDVLDGLCTAAHTHAGWTVVFVMPPTATPDMPQPEWTTQGTLIRPATPTQTKPHSRTSHTSLTARELEVLKLLADGSTNPQIAAALWISPKTASVHVSHILAKLKTPTRAGAAGAAHRLGILQTRNSRSAHRDQS
jgi:DNA-binding CsgD family transcriptional regulator